MARLLRTAMFFALILIARPAFAGGGTCPSGADYVPTSLSNPGGSLATLASLGVTQCFYIAASGSDSNDGLSEAPGHPWAHAPGMPNCTATCASTTVTPGTGFIFRGGDTWHFGDGTQNSSAGGLWKWKVAGSNGSPIYIGVDLSWFSGASWSRPILSGDNPLTPNPGVILDFVSSCTFQVSGTNAMVNPVSVFYTIFDYFEFTGLCQSSTGQPSGNDQYLTGWNSSPTTVNWITRVYLHGWSDQNFGSSAHSIDNIGLLSIGSAVAFRYVVVDGSDSDPGAGMVFTAGSGSYDTSYSVFRYTAQMVMNQCHLFHDNLVEHWAAEVHPNLFECVGEPANSTGAYYNNIFRHICTDNDSHGTNLCSPNNSVVGIWPERRLTTTDYYFNNLMYDFSSGVEYFNVGQNRTDQGPLVIFNNTMEQQNSGSIFGCSASGFAFPITFANNHYIIDQTPYRSTCAGQETAGSRVGDLVMNHATATAQGYTSSETFAYSPVASTNSTVGAGRNEAIQNGVFCSALSQAAASDISLTDAASACLSETRYACSYDSTNHIVSCPTRSATSRPKTGAWDSGAYQFSSSQTGTGPNPPTNLTATVQ